MPNDLTALADEIERAAHHEKLVFDALHKQMEKQAQPYGMYSDAYDVTAYRRAALLECAAAIRAKSGAA